MNDRITLTTAQQWWADAIATTRQRLAEMRGRISTRGFTGDQNGQLAIHRLGTFCELAGKLFFNPIHWNAILDDPQYQPDLWTEYGLKVDIKGVDRDSKHLLIRRDEPIHGNWAYVKVSAQHHPEYWLHGWVWGNEITADMLGEADPDRTPCYLVPHNKLRPIETLEQIKKEMIHT
jgi:hypothetical protein